jgi:hypothetical protein
MLQKRCPCTTGDYRVSIASELQDELGPNPSEKPKAKRSGRSAGKHNGPSVFELANEIDTLRVLDQLGIAYESTPRGEMAECPGCGESGALVCRDGGVKCQHDRCNHAGPPNNPGFRTNVDLVIAVKDSQPVDAAKTICDWFGIPIPGPNKANGSPCDDGWNPTDDDDPRAPPKDKQSSKPAEPIKLPFLWVRDFGELMKPPELRWLFKDIRTGKPFCRAGKCYALSADGGVGKGFFTLQTGVSIATGYDLFDAFRPEQAGRVAILAAEDDQDEIHHRLYRISNAMGIGEDQKVRDNIGVFPLSGEQVNLLETDAARNQQRTEILGVLIDQLTEMAKDGGFEWSLIAIDPLARFGSSNVEIDQGAATAFTAALEFMSDNLPGTPTIGVNHHSSAASVQSGRSNMRGVTGLRDAFRLVMSLDAFSTASGLRGVLVRNTKNNLAPEAPPLWLVRLDNEPMGDGSYLETSGVLRRATEDEIEELEAVAGSTVGASREQREQAKTTAKQAKFEADCQAVLSCLPETPASVSSDELIARLSAIGKGCSVPTLKPRMAHLTKEGMALDLSDGSQGTARKWARPAKGSTT